MAIAIKNEIEFETLNYWNNIGDQIDIVGIRTKNLEKKLQSTRKMQKAESKS